jgi:hypothetical protein
VVYAQLRSLDSADALSGLEECRPDDPANFQLSVGAVIGPDDSPGGELFYFSVCTAQWLLENPPPKDFEFLHHVLLVTRWDAEVVLRAIGDLCRRTVGDDWNEVALKLSRYGAWEFDDYRP